MGRDDGGLWYREVRDDAASRAASAAAVLGADFTKAHLVPQLRDIVLSGDADANGPWTAKIAKVMFEMAGPMGAELSKEVYLRTPCKEGDGNSNILEALLISDGVGTSRLTNTNLRLDVAEMLFPLISVIAFPSGRSRFPFVQSQNQKLQDLLLPCPTGWSDTGIVCGWR